MGGISDKERGTLITQSPTGSGTVQGLGSVTRFLWVGALACAIGIGVWVWKNRVGGYAPHSYLEHPLPEVMILGVEKNTTLIIKDSKGVQFTQRINAAVEFKNAVTGKVEDAAIWFIEDNRYGAVVVSIVPKTVGQFDFSVVIGGKSIPGGPWRITFKNDDKLYDDFPIILNPALEVNQELVMFGKHSDTKPIRPSDIDYPPLIQAIKECDNYWPRNVQFLYNIGMDYGRSHYFFTDGDENIPVKIHTYGFRNYQASNVSPEECNAYFNTLGIKGPIITIFPDPSPTRSNLITRTKYELLQRYILSKGKTEDQASRLSIGIMASTTQHTLRYLSGLIMESLPHDFRHQISFCYFQINITHQNNYIFLKISLINYIPTSGTWQSSPTKTIPMNNRKNIRAEFIMNMENEADRGILTVTIDGSHDYFGRPGLSDAERRQKFGILLADKQTVIHFKDTSPTW